MRHRRGFPAFLLPAVSLFLLSSPLQAQPKQGVHHPEGRYLQLLGKKIWVENEGSGEALLLIPGGGGGSHDYYHPYFSRLARSFRVIYYDGFGRGKSERAAAPSEYTFQHDLDEIEALRRALGVKQFIIYGHSYGGFVAMGYALKYPGSVSRLLVSNIFTCAADYQESNDHFNDEIKEFLPELWARIEPLRKKGYLASSPELQKAYLGQFPAMLRLFYFYDPSKASVIEFSDAVFNAEEYYQLIGPDADFKVGGDIGKLDFRPRLSAIKVPFLVMAGRKDGVVLPRLSTKFKKYAPQARFVMFERSGHFPFIEETAAYMKTLKEFLQPGSGR